MARLKNSHWSPSLALLLFIIGGPAPAVAQSNPGATPIPGVAGPIPVTADSYPLMAASRLQEAVDLTRLGYVEEEFFVSGRANVYDWAADGKLSAKTTAAPYTTRILLRRPASPRNFSGTVIVELPNMARRYDWSMTWALSYAHVIENGHAWVGLTFSPVGIDGLKAFNPNRYAPLSMASPTPEQVCAGGPGGGAPAPSATEEGLDWDIISQVGALLKEARPGGPLAGFAVQRVYGTSHGGELPTYIAAIHPHANLANGRPIYDGYLVIRHVGLTRMHRCAAAPAADDPRQILRNVSVPVIRLIAGETDALATYARRREDGDAPGDRYRLYEVAGAPHADAVMYRFIPSRADQTAVGTFAYLAFWPFQNQCEQELPLMTLPIMTYAVDAALANLDRWVRDGAAPPRAARISIQNGGTPQARVVTDEFGNAAGGVRSPYLDVPVATYHVSRAGGQLAPGVRCDEIGYKVPFDWARLEAVYGTSRNYAAKVADSVGRLVRERWLTESDGRKIQAELVVPPLSSR